jgi:hypothetical protein
MEQKPQEYHGQIGGHKILMATLDYFYIMIESIKL